MRKWDSRKRMVFGVGLKMIENAIIGLGTFLIGFGCGLIYCYFKKVYGR